MRHPAKVGCRFFVSAFFKTAALIGPDTSLHAARRFSAFKFFAPVVLYLPHRHLAIQRQGLACPKSCPKTATYRSLRSLQLAALTPSAAQKTFKNRPRRVSQVSPASAFLDIPRAGGARFELFML